MLKDYAPMLGGLLGIVIAAYVSSQFDLNSVIGAAMILLCGLIGVMIGVLYNIKDRPESSEEE